jgi:hypothetical protein
VPDVSTPDRRARGMIKAKELETLSLPALIAAYEYSTDEVERALVLDAIQKRLMKIHRERCSCDGVSAPGVIDNKEEREP